METQGGGVAVYKTVLSDFTHVYLHRSRRDYARQPHGYITNMGDI